MIPLCILAIEDESDREFMTNLYIQYQGLMFSTIKKIVDDYWLEEDIVQIACEKLIDKIPLLKTLSCQHLIDYIIVTCRNTAYNELRYRKRHYTISFDDYMVDIPSDNNRNAMDAQIILSDDFNKLSEIWPLLDDRTRYLLEARYILNLKTSQIAEDLQIQPESVRMALTRARKTAYVLIQKATLKG